MRLAWSLVSEYMYLDFNLQKHLQGCILAGRDYRMNAGGGVLVWI
jgi:hypothetical protein